MTLTAPNAEQIRCWNEVSGPKWVALHDKIDALIGALGLRALDRAEIAPGSRVLDVGCGCGDTTVEIARRIGPRGGVTGLDVSRVMLDRAGEAARAAAAMNVTLEEADAQTVKLPAGSFDLLFSRFGVMFFSDPEAAFANLRRALRPRARLTFVCWRAPDQNPWTHVPLAALARHIHVPEIQLGAPGPFGFADDERVRGILRRAGFHDVAFEAVDELVSIGGGELDETVELLLELGPAAKALREAGCGKTDVVRSAVREAVTPYMTPDGVRMIAAAWIVTGKNAEFLPA
jgi:ubiquinone/menaquinone biosynthesis C-methylase UbiE